MRCTKRAKQLAGKPSWIVELLFCFDRETPSGRNYILRIQTDKMNYELWTMCLLMYNNMFMHSVH